MNLQVSIGSDQQQSIINKRNKTAMDSLKYLLVLYAFAIVLNRLILTLNYFIIFSVEKGSKVHNFFIYIEMFMDPFQYVNNVTNVFIYAGKMARFRKFLRSPWRKQAS